MTKGLVGVSRPLLGLGAGNFRARRAFKVKKFPVKKFLFSRPQLNLVLVTTTGRRPVVVRPTILGGPSTSSPQGY